MKFAVVAHWYGEVQGGIEQHATYLASALRSEGHEVGIINHDAVPALTPGEWDGVLVEGIHRATLLALRRLTGWATVRKVLFTHGSFYLRTHPSVREEVGYREPWLPQVSRDWFDAWFMGAILDEYDAVLALAGEEAADLVTSYPRLRAKVAAVPNFGPPVRSDLISGPSPPNGSPYVCSVARIERRKNLETAIRAVHGTGVRFLLAGADRGDLGRLSRLAEALHVAEFEYLGPISEARKVELIRGALAMIIPSYFEGVPYTALESLSLGCPVVCTRNSYVADWAGITRCAPTPEAFRAAILNVRDSPREKIPFSYPSDSRILDALWATWGMSRSS